MTRYLLIILTCCSRRAPGPKYAVASPGIEAGRTARIGNCNIAKHGDTEAVFDACRYWQPCEVEARLRAGEIVEVLSVPTATRFAAVAYRLITTGSPRSEPQATSNLTHWPAGPRGQQHRETRPTQLL